MSTLRQITIVELTQRSERFKQIQFTECDAAPNVIRKSISVRRIDEELPQISLGQSALNFNLCEQAASRSIQGVSCEVGCDQFHVHTAHLHAHVREQHCDGVRFLPS